MRKILLMLALMLTILVSAQVQERHQYTNVSLVEGDKVETKKLDCTVYVSYENKPTIKILFPSGILYYDCVSEIGVGATNNGSKFWYATYKERGSDNMILVQVFKEDEYGIRFIDGQGNMVQFY